MQNLKQRFGYGSLSRPGCSVPWRHRTEFHVAQLDNQWPTKNPLDGSGDDSAFVDDGLGMVVAPVEPVIFQGGHTIQAFTLSRP